MTKKSAESLATPLHFSDGTWAAQHLNKMAILKHKDGFRGFLLHVHFLGRFDYKQSIK